MSWTAVREAIAAAEAVVQRVEASDAPTLEYLTALEDLDDDLLTLNEKDLSRLGKVMLVLSRRLEATVQREVIETSAKNVVDVIKEKVDRDG